MRSIRLVAFTLLAVVLLPIMVLGTILYCGTMLRCRRAGVSYTAYEPLGARVLLEGLGERPDAASRALVYALPTSVRPGVALAYEPLITALRISGYRPRFAQYPIELPSSIVTMFAHRTQFFDRACLAALECGHQLLILGAGWDTRAYQMARAHDVPIYEVDAPATQAVKRTGVERAGLGADHVHFVPVDFQTQDWLEELRARGFNAGRPTFVLWEGVTYYLTDDAVARTLDRIGHLAPGSEVCLDYFTAEALAGEGPKTCTRGARWLEWMNEPWRFGIARGDDTSESAASWMQEHGLDLVAHEAFGAPGEEFGGVLQARRR